MLVKQIHRTPNLGPGCRQQQSQLQQHHEFLGRGSARCGRKAQCTLPSKTWCWVAEAGAAASRAMEAGSLQGSGSHGRGISVAAPGSRLGTGQGCGKEPAGKRQAIACQAARHEPQVGAGVTPLCMGLRCADSYIIPVMLIDMSGPVSTILC